MIGSALVKVIICLAIRRMEQKAHSPAILASARDNLAEVISAATALAGVLAAGWLHPMAGLAVSVWIFRNAAVILVENLGYLTGHAAEPELLEQIYAVARQVAGVAGVRRVIADHVGPQMRAELHVEVDGGISFDDAHRIGNDVRDAVEALDDVDLAFIHVEPVQPHSEATMIMATSRAQVWFAF